MGIKVQGVPFLCFLQFLQMVKPKHFLWLLAAAFALASCSGDGEGVQGRSGNANANSTVLTPEAGRLEFPKTRDDGRSIVIVHSTDGYGINYAVEWDCDKRAQRWTCYQMYASNSVTNWNRNKWDDAYWDGRYWNGDPFQEDPGLPEGCRTTLKLEDERKISMRRTGASRSELTIERGVRNVGFYGTVAGDLQIGVFAEEIQNRLTDEGGQIYFKYQLDVNSVFLSENEVTINVKSE